MLFDSYFHEVADPGAEIQFRYDYDNLLRWLLKIAYNTARSTANPNTLLLQPIAPYIIGLSARPSGVELYLDIVTHSMIPTISGVKIFPATAFRSARVDGEPPLPGWCLVRLVAINSFYFYMLLFKEDNHESDKLEGVKQSIKGALILPENSEILLPPSTTGAFEVHKDHMLSKYDKYRKFFSGDGE